ncbi:hypothetical protein CBR_g6443 [Chara braunii]|uniref:Uncharacterized protein n=1 Tax=Chara braunii TaxID=69332 RepID=A0A388KJW5_CHABU|nr:hypothetical protein CBR_g6443 [Chara braunii]|eukprot:GBG70316.1 hypothetical protein CBR_g6443 [Chara braunii]
MGDSTMIRKDDDDMELDTLTEQPTGGVNDGATIVGSFGSLVATMAAGQGVFEMMETDAGQDGESQTVKLVQEEEAAATEQTKKEMRNIEEVRGCKLGWTIHLATDKLSEKETIAVQHLRDSVQVENRTVWTSTYNRATKEELTLTGSRQLVEHRNS